ncbi:MAG: nitrogen fixation protein NifZ [Candidatus Contendobacter sp.]|nr:nitrogen fixation protein NifZ [Candidatus Contendobacter sp.]
MILEPRFACDDAVRTIRNIRNDGTYPGQPTGALLVRRGSVGYVRHIGVFLQDQIIYTVHFLEAGNRIVGCRETELIPADAPWTPNRFERGDHVIARRALVVGSETVGVAGAAGEIMAVIRESETIHYHVLFDKRVFQVPEDALDDPASANFFSRPQIMPSARLE